MSLGGGGRFISPICMGDDIGVPLLEGARLGSRLWVLLLRPLMDDLAESVFRGSCSLSSSAMEFQLGLRSIAGIFEGCMLTIGKALRLSSLARLVRDVTTEFMLSIRGNVEVEARPTC